jgi:midasin
MLKPDILFCSILSALLKKPRFLAGPLSFVLTCEHTESIDTSRLHRLLLAYYRILQANRELPKDLFWSPAPLSKLFWTPHPDTGVRLLAIRCYALQTGMCEAEKEKLETEVLGGRIEVDCHLEYGQEVDGSVKMIDGWVMPMLELKRVTDARNAMVSEPEDYYSAEEGDVTRPIHQSELRQVAPQLPVLVC